MKRTPSKRRPARNKRRSSSRSRLTGRRGPSLESRRRLPPRRRRSRRRHEVADCGEGQSMDSSVIAVGIIETFAGNGKSRSTGDGKIATKAGLPLPIGLAIDPAGQFLYFAESGSDRVRRVEFATSIINHVAGIGETCYSGDSGPAAEAGLYLPLDVAFDSQGDLYICDSGSNRIRKIDMQTGVMDTIVGTC